MPQLFNENLQIRAAICFFTDINYLRRILLRVKRQIMTRAFGLQDLLPCCKVEL